MSALECWSLLLNAVEAGLSTGKLSPDEARQLNAEYKRLMRLESAFSESTRNAVSDESRPQWIPNGNDWVLLPDGEIGLFIGFGKESIRDIPDRAAIVYCGDTRKFYSLEALRPYVAEGIAEQELTD